MPVEQTRSRMCPSWEVDVLGDIEAVEYFHKFTGCFTVFGVNVNIEVAQEQDGW